MGDDARSLDGRTILAIFAHPDDESLACGGTLARLADRGARVVLLCASRGERGSISDPSLVADGDLGRVRAHELEQAARVLGIRELLLLDHPDGNLRWARVTELQTQIAVTLRSCRPDAVITFDKDGLYWHLDHIAIHERTATAVRSLGVGAPPLYYVTMAKGVMRGIVETAIDNGWAPADSSFWGIAPDAFGAAADPPSFVVDVRDWVSRKLKALRCHRTQMGATNPFTCIDEREARQWLGVEQFRRAPIPSVREPVLEQLGDAVPST